MISISYASYVVLYTQIYRFKKITDKSCQRLIESKKRIIINRKTFLYDKLCLLSSICRHSYWIDKYAVWFGVESSKMATGRVNLNLRWRIQNSDIVLYSYCLILGLYPPRIVLNNRTFIKSYSFFGLIHHIYTSNWEIS